MSTTAHDRTLELLPWLVNGTLEGDERREVEAHLASCPECRGELAATRQAYEVYAAHLPAAALTAYVADPGAPSWEVDGRPLERGLVEAHLAACGACRDEVEMLRAGLAAVDDDGAAAPATRGVLPFAPRPAPAPRRAVPAWLPAALAASLLLAVLSGGGWYRSYHDLESAERQVAALRTASELAPVIEELYLGQRGDEPVSADPVRVDPEALLAFQVYGYWSDLERARDFSYRVVDASGRTVLRGEPTLRPKETRSYLWIQLPAWELPAGDLTLEVLDGDEVRVRRTLDVP
jgi:anti-sigma factor RsiW